MSAPAPTSLEVAHETPQIASWRHLAGFLLIGATMVGLGLLAQHAPTLAGADPDQLGRHSQAVYIYLVAIFMDCALLYYCWIGVHRCGGNLETLSGARRTSWKSIAVDFGIALPSWLLLRGTASYVYWLLGPNSAKTVDGLLPQSLLEVVLWIATSISAGICEEMAFRGYAQRQFHALTGSIVVAVLIQGVVFGLFHFYQGWKSVVVISLLGVMLGALAAWRRDLRANIIVHAWADLWSGWLKFLVVG
jgi:uncharacterized protein